MMTDVGEGASCMMKVCGATESTLTGNRYETVYFEAKATTKVKEVCGATSHMMDILIVVKHKVDGTQLLIYIYIYTYIHTYNILPYFCHSKMITMVTTLLGKWFPLRGEQK